MNRLTETDDDLRYDTPDREISLGTPTILGIFFALALVCAVFFGLGYTMGRKSTQSTGTSVEVAATPSTAAKPTAGSPAYSAPAAPPPPESSVTVSNDALSTPPSPSTRANPADGAIVGEKIPLAAPAPPPTTSAPPPAGSFMVQVAAVSSQDVADIEIAALTKKGYSVAVHHEPQDQLLHIQIGPFASRKDADAMRQRVLADGFNAIVK